MQPPGLAQAQARTLGLAHRCTDAAAARLGRPDAAPGCWRMTPMRCHPRSARSIHGPVPAPRSRRARGLPDRAQRVLWPAAGRWTRACSTRAPTPKPWWTGRWKCSPPDRPAAPRVWTWAPAAAPLRWPAAPAPHSPGAGRGCQLRCPGRGAGQCTAPGPAGAVCTGPLAGRCRRAGLTPSSPTRPTSGGRPAPGRADPRTPAGPGQRRRRTGRHPHHRAQAPAHLVPGGWLLLEHGWDQAPTRRTP
jgi:hypothetical protein